VVGGDAVATRRFLGIPPPLATLLAHATAAPLSSLRDLSGAAESPSGRRRRGASACVADRPGAWAASCL